MCGVGAEICRREGAHGREAEILAEEIRVVGGLRVSNFRSPWHTKAFGEIHQRDWRARAQAKSRSTGDDSGVARSGNHEFGEIALCQIAWRSGSCGND